MSSYNELIKNFERIRGYMREFYVYGFKSRNDYDKKSARSYDDERRRLESWLGDYMRFERNRDGKNMFISIDSRVTVHNPLYRAFKAKSFTDRDITLHFIIFDILYDSTVKMTLPEILDTIDNEYLCDFPEPMVFDESTVRKKLKEYVEEGIFCTEKEGRTVLYYRAPDNVKINGDAVQFFSEIAPCGVIGSYILDKLSEPQENFSFKHHYINVALDSDVLATIFDAMSKKSYITVTNLGRKSGEPKSVKLVPLRVFCSVQNGRQHLLAYEPCFREIKSYRVDYLSDVKVDEVCENFDKYRALMNDSQAYMWGVNNHKNLEKLESVEFTVFFDKNEEYIVGRLMREKRCGKVEQIDENHCRFTIETFNCNELVPWIRTFICRITDIHFSDPFVDKRFKKDLQNIIESTAFAESSLTILPAIKNGKWQVINEDLSTPILNTPTMPLTNLQKRWLKSLSLDPRIRLFNISFDGLEDVEPLFTPEDYVVYDRYLDGDPYYDEAYIRNFKTILEAIKNKTPLKIEILNRLHQPVTLNTLPIRLEYSEKDDKFRMISKGCKYGGTINIARITNIEKYNCDAINLSKERKPEYKLVTLKVFDKRNTLERSMLHFAHFEKQVEKLDEETYMVHIKYDKDDETELVIRVLGFGPMVEVIEPDGFRNLIIERLKKQKTLI